MPTEAIPFGDQQASGLDELAGASPLVVNALTDMAGTRKLRPGIATWSGFPTTIPEASPVESMCVFNGSLIYCTRTRKLYQVAPSTATATALHDSSVATLLAGTLKPQLFPTRTRVIAVGGDAPQKWEGTGLSARLGGSPPNLTTVTGIATRLVGNVNDTSGIFRWSGLGETTGHETWDALNFAEAEAKPDILSAVADNTNELFAFGAETLQVYGPDAISGFAPGRTLNIGLIAPYSVVKVDDQFAFLDRERRFVLTDGRSFSDSESVLSKPIEGTLRGLSTVTDCWGFRMRVDRWDVPVWMFPTDGLGFMWDRRNRGWSEWRAWGTNGYTAPTVTSALHWPEQNVFLVGLSSGQVAKLDATATADLDAVVKVELVTGFQDRGTDNRKKCTAARFVFKRGQESTTAPVVNVSYRDDLGAFGAPTTFDLGIAGDYAPTLEIRSAGVYRRRQWKLEYTSDADFTFVGAREEYEVLAN